MNLGVAAAGLVLVASAVIAEAPDESLRPMARPVAAVMPALLIETVPRPVARSAGLLDRFRAGKRGSGAGRICDDRRIEGEAIGAVPGKIAGCGVANAVRVRAVSGVALSQPAVMDCTTAKALQRWVVRGMNRAMHRKGGGVKTILVAAHYACRTRNSQAGARISEHGKGRAIDIYGFRLQDGTVVTVKDGWGSRRYGKPLKKMRKAACGPFGTVLGPGSDRFHDDHFHFDTARHRSGPYCR